MAASRITFTTGEAVVVDGSLEAVVEELHNVFTRRERTFAVLRRSDGGPIAVRPDAVLHVEPAGGDATG